MRKILLVNILILVFYSALSLIVDYFYVRADFYVKYSDLVFFTIPVTSFLLTWFLVKENKLSKKILSSLTASILVTLLFAAFVLNIGVRFHFYIGGSI